MVDRSESSFAELFAAGDARWEEFREYRGDTFHAFVPADYVDAAHALRQLRPQADSFLELGSGVGVVAITAALLGFDAAGIEIDPWLVDASEDLAEQFGAEVCFAEGTFVPPEFQEHVDRQDTEIPTVADGLPGYDDLDRDLADFDLVYAFPWPGLEEVFFELMARHGGEGALFLTYGGLEGYRLWRDGVELQMDGSRIG
jgi:hypothetical protein